MFFIHYISLILRWLIDFSVARLGISIVVDVILAEISSVEVSLPLFFKQKKKLENKIEKQNLVFQKIKEKKFEMQQNY